MKEEDRPPPADTIAAISTAPGRAGVAVIRVSGPGAGAIAAALGAPKLTPRRATLAALRHPDEGRLIDRALLTFFVGPASYTGEDVLEISGHGGSLVPQLILDGVCAAGARLAEPGEFTRRAFLNGRIDLVQAEATLDLIDARSPIAHQTALFQLERGLSRRIQELRERLIRLQAMLAYEIDFPEEDDGPIPGGRMEAAGSAVLEGLRALLRYAPEGEMVRDGALTVIAGRPNAGKSSLFNALLGEARAIVTEEPGTTRDAIEALLSVEGYPFRLVDTAGFRSEPGRVESLGIEVAESYLDRADLVLFCAEAGRALDEEERAFLRRWSPAAARQHDARAGRRVVLVRTKADLAVGGGEPNGFAVSIVDGDGLSALRAAMLEAVYAGVRQAEELPLVTRRRHQRALTKAASDVQRFISSRDTGNPPEISATHLQDAQLALEGLLGVIDTEDVLDVVFAMFCVGK